MKALTILQPWASLIANGMKAVETRSWYTHYRGPLLIHAGKGWNDSCQWFWEECVCDGLLTQEKPPRGVILARCDLVSCEPTETINAPPGEVRLGDYRPGRFGWILANVKRLDKPIPATGKLGFWNFDTDLHLANPCA